MSLKIVPNVLKQMVGSPQTMGARAAKVPEPTVSRGAPALAMTLGAISEELPVLPRGKFAVPAGYKASAPVDEKTHTATAADGRTATLKWSDQSLSVTDRAGKTSVLLPKDDASFEELKAQLDDEVKNAEPDGYFPHDYFGQASVSGVGSAGKMMSVRFESYGYSGGAHPWGGTSYVTFDARSGRSVTLDELLSPAQFKSVVEQIRRRMPKIDEYGTFKPFSSSQTGEPTYDDWATVVAPNFALVTDGRGDRYIRVGWESGVYALGTTAARFTFKAPTDAAFLQKIGAK